MDVFTRTALHAALSRLEQGEAPTPAELSRVVTLISRCRRWAEAPIAELTRALIAQDARPNVLSALLDVWSRVVAPSLRPRALAFMAVHAAREDAYEVVLQVSARVPARFGTGASEGACIAAMLERVLPCAHKRTALALLEAWIARRDVDDPAMAEFVRSQTSAILALAPSDAVVIAVHRLAPSTSTWRALADRLRARRAGREVTASTAR